MQSSKIAKHLQTQVLKVEKMGFSQPEAQQFAISQYGFAKLYL